MIKRINTLKSIYNKLSKVYNEFYSELIHKIENDNILNHIIDKCFLKGNMFFGEKIKKLLNNCKFSKTKSYV